MASLGARVCVALLVCCSMSLTSPKLGMAQESEAAVSSDAEARELFAAGRAAFAEGRYEDARAHFRRSYELSRRPQLLYNLGAVEDRLRHDEEALAAFEQYLAALPDAENAAEVRARIRALREAIARAAADGTAMDPSSASTPPPSASTSAPVATIVLASLALAAGAASAGTWVAANDAYAERERGCFARGGCDDGELAGVGTLVDATNGLWVSALVLGAGAAIALSLELTVASSSGETTSRARLQLQPTSISLRVEL